MSSPPKGWAGFGALKEAQRQRDKAAERSTQLPQTQVQETEASRTQVQGTPVPESAPVRERPQPRSESAATPRTEVHGTQARRTQVRQTQVPENQASRPVGPRKEGYTRLNNWVLDDFLPRLDPYEQLVYLRLFRLTVGFNRPTCTVSHEKLAEKTNLSVSTVKRVCGRLVNLGHIRSVAVLGGSRLERGCEFELVEPISSSQTRVPGTRVPGTRVPGTDMKDHEIHVETAAPDIYEIRRTAARLHEAEPDLAHDDLVTAVRRAYVAEGRGVTREQIEEAIRGLAL